MLYRLTDQKKRTCSRIILTQKTSLQSGGSISMSPRENEIGQLVVDEPF